MKSYTSLEQSCKLAEILPPGSSDMYYHNRVDIPDNFPLPIEWKRNNPLLSQEIPCWSLAALLKVIRKSVGYELLCNGTSITIKCELGDNPWSIKINENNEVDACYEMIIKLHELNLL